MRFYRKTKRANLTDLRDFSILIFMAGRELVIDDVQSDDNL